MRAFLTLLVAVLCLASAPASAEIFHSKESALRLAFPDADEVVARDLILTRAQTRRIEELAGSALPSRLVTVYEGRLGGELQGYAFFDTHTVRTLPETFLLVLDPAGEVVGTHILAFHEPREYLPPPRWLEQFGGRELDDELWLDRGVAAIAGSTMSAQAVTAGVRRLLAVHRVMLEAPEEPSAALATR